MKHMMVDIETLGRSPGCVILSCAAVNFDLAGERDRGRRWNISVRSSLAAGLTVCGDTFEWWMEQKPSLLKAMATDAMTLKKFCMNLNGYYLCSPAEYVWSHGSNFDLPILDAAYKALGLAVPWHYRKTRDTRTLYWIAEHFGLEAPPKGAGAHDPLADCHRQISWVQDSWQTIVKG